MTENSSPNPSIPSAKTKHGPLRAGVVFGVILAAIAARAVRSMLFVVSPHDGVTFVLAPAILVLAGALACWLPAWRATSVDPAIALRDE